LASAQFWDGNLAHGGFQFWIKRFRGVPVHDSDPARFCVKSHATLDRLLVAYGELAIGIALVLGVLVRPASAFGLLYMQRCYFPQIVGRRSRPLQYSALH
jgi:uncharacterized membrane protein YphA (DoxX/SURF4 family)